MKFGLILPFLFLLLIGCSHQKETPQNSEPQPHVFGRGIYADGFIELAFETQGIASAMDEFSFLNGKTDNLVLESPNGEKLLPGAEDFHPTLSGGEIFIKIPITSKQIPDRLLIKGDFVAQNPDGSLIASYPLPHEVKVFFSNR